MNRFTLFLILLAPVSLGLVPPKFQWKKLDFAWPDQAARDAAIESSDYVPENNMPTGLAKWKNKLFIVIPRWKSGIPSSLNYIDVDSSQDALLNPYPSWSEAFVTHNACSINSNSTVVSAYKVTVDDCNRLWVVDNGVTDMMHDMKQIAPPSIMIFDLNTDSLIRKHQLGNDVLKNSSVLSSVVVDTPDRGKDRCLKSFAYITDMGSNAVIVYDLCNDNEWRVENSHFKFDPNAAEYKVGGIEFYWPDGISSATLSSKNRDGDRDFYFHPTSSTKLFKMSTRHLKNPTSCLAEMANSVECVGEKGPMSQSTSCYFDPQSDVIFYTMINKNAVGCWNSYKPFNEKNAAVIFSDCTLLEFPNDVTVDDEGNIWILSNRQARFFSSALDFNTVNFRILTSPVKEFTKGTPCEKVGSFAKLFIQRPTSKKGKDKIKCCQA